MFKVPEDFRLRRGKFASSPAQGNNGWFIIPHPNEKHVFINCCASDGLGWEHVSITLSRKDDDLQRNPTWEEMCLVKSLFWGQEDTVLQFHPAESAYVNFHPYCLHLWRPIGCTIPEPSPLLVGGGL